MTRKDRKTTPKTLARSASAEAIAAGTAAGALMLGAAQVGAMPRQAESTADTEGASQSPSSTGASSDDTVASSSDPGRSESPVEGPSAATPPAAVAQTETADPNPAASVEAPRDAAALVPSRAELNDRPATAQAPELEAHTAKQDAPSDEATAGAAANASSIPHQPGETLADSPTGQIVLTFDDAVTLPDIPDSDMFATAVADLTAVVADETDTLGSSLETGLAELDTQLANALEPVSQDTDLSSTILTVAEPALQEIDIAEPILPTVEALTSDMGLPMFEAEDALSNAIEDIGANAVLDIPDTILGAEIDAPEADLLSSIFYSDGQSDAAMQPSAVLEDIAATIPEPVEDFALSGGMTDSVIAPALIGMPYGSGTDAMNDGFAANSLSAFDLA